MTPRSPTPMIGRHCDRSVVTVASHDRHPAGPCRVTDTERGIQPPDGFPKALYPARRLNRCALAGETDIENPGTRPGRPAPSRAPPAFDAAAPVSAPRTNRASEEQRDFRRSNPFLCRLWGGIHPLGGRSGVL